MRIGIDFTQAQYQGTGVGEYTKLLLDHLLDLNTGDSFLLFGASLRDFRRLRLLAEAKVSRSRIYPIPPTGLEWLFNRYHRLPIEFFTGPLDIFHASDWAQPPARKARLVTTVHDLTPLLFPQHHHPKIVAAFTRRLRWVEAEAAQVICDSEATQTDLLAHTRLDPAQVSVVPLAASPRYARFARLPQPAKDQAWQALTQTHHLPQPYLLSVGTREPRKNLSRVVAAFAKFVRTNPGPLDLVIAGKYGWGSELAGLPPSLHSRIRLLGFVADADLPALYARAQAFLYPSLYEGFGLPVLEAMTVGTPVVTSKRGSLGEVAGAAAVLVDPESVTSIRHGINRAFARRPELTRLGFRQAEKFSWTHTAAATLAVYQRALKA